MNYKKIVGLRFSGYGHYKVIIAFRNQMYSSITTDMPAVDAYKSKEHGWKSAGNSLYKSVVRKLDLR